MGNLHRDAWTSLNDMQWQAEAKDDARQPRDLDAHPWGPYDDANVAELLRQMDGRIARMELRQGVIFEAVAATREMILRLVIGGGLAAGVVLIYRAIQ